jgi:hypothetical protein
VRPPSEGRATRVLVAGSPGTSTPAWPGRRRNTSKQVAALRTSGSLLGIARNAALPDDEPLRQCWRWRCFLVTRRPAVALALGDDQEWHVVAPSGEVPHRSPKQVVESPDQVLGEHSRTMVGIVHCECLCRLRVWEVHYVEAAGPPLAVQGKVGPVIRSAKASMYDHVRLVKLGSVALIIGVHSGATVNQEVHRNREYRLALWTPGPRSSGEAGTAHATGRCGIRFCRVAQPGGTQERPRQGGALRDTRRPLRGAQVPAGRPAALGGRGGRGRMTCPRAAVKTPGPPARDTARGPHGREPPITRSAVPTPCR